MVSLTDCRRALNYVQCIERILSCELNCQLHASTCMWACRVDGMSNISKGWGGGTKWQVKCRERWHSIVHTCAQLNALIDDGVPYISRARYYTVCINTGRSDAAPHKHECMSSWQVSWTMVYDKLNSCPEYGGRQGGSFERSPIGTCSLSIRTEWCQEADPWFKQDALGELWWRVMWM